jgi:membrane-bound lytic murein transglycosylase MltF
VLKQLIIRWKVKLVFDAEFGESEWGAADFIIQKESRWNPYAINSTSGACGFAQSLPCSKLLNRCKSLENIKCQAEWMRDYIKNRFLTPSRAQDFWNWNGWY